MMGFGDRDGVDLDRFTKLLKLHGGEIVLAKQRHPHLPTKRLKAAQFVPSTTLRARSASPIQVQ
jgi:hypothetical protein